MMGLVKSDKDGTVITSNLALKKETTAKKVQKVFQIQNQRFNQKFDSLENKLWTAPNKHHRKVCKRACTGRSSESHT